MLNQCLWDGGFGIVAVVLLHVCDLGVCGGDEEFFEGAWGGRKKETCIRLSGHSCHERKRDERKQREAKARPETRRRERETSGEGG